MEAGIGDYIQEHLRWYKNKDVVPVLEARQEGIVFYRKENIDILQFGCILHNSIKFCLQKVKSKDAIL